MYFTAPDLFETVALAPVLAAQSAAGTRCALMQGFVARDFGVIETVPAAGLVDVLLNPRTPCYITGLGAYATGAGFEVEIRSEGEGRLFSSPVRSQLFTAQAVPGVTLQVRPLSAPRYCSGPVRVRIRSRDTGATQDCGIVLSIAEPIDHNLPAVVEQERDLLFGLAPDDQTGIQTSAPRVGFGFAPSGGGGGGLDLTNLRDQIINISISNGAAYLLVGDGKATTEVWSFFMYLDSQQPDAQTVLLSAENARGELRQLVGPINNLQPGGNISFDLGTARWFYLEPGEKMRVSVSSAGGVLATFGGLIKYRLV